MDKLPFNFTSVPSTWELCFNKDCMHKDTCMHYFAGQHLPADKIMGFAIYPNTLQNEKCRFYIGKRMIRATWGFRKLFLKVKHVDDTPIRRKIQQHLGSRPTYYRYMNGQLTLTPEQQKGIINIFRSYGYTEELDFDNYIDRYSYE